MKLYQKALVILAIVLTILIVLTIVFNTPIKKAKCELLPKNGFMGDCPEANCYYNLALDKKDPHICELIQPGVGGAKGTCNSPARCLGRFGLPYMYVEPCLENPDHCFSYVNTAEMCSEAKTETGKKYCYEKLEEKEPTSKEKIYKAALESSDVNECLNIYTNTVNINRAKIEWETDKAREKNCIIQKALEKEDVEICSTLKNKSYRLEDSFNWCINQVAIKTNNINACQLTEDYTQYCERDFTWAKAIKELDVEQCPKKNFTERTINQFGEIIKNTTIELIENTKCAKEIAKKTKDVTICERMDRDRKIYQWTPVNCVTQIAVEHEDKSYCDLIKWDFYKRKCKQRIDAKIN